MTAGLVTQAAASPPSWDNQNRAVMVRNQTGLTLRTLTIADARTSVFGDNLLAGAPLPSGEARRVMMDVGANVCRVVVQVELSSGQRLTRGDVNACQMRDLTLTR